MIHQAKKRKLQRFLVVLRRPMCAIFIDNFTFKPSKLIIPKETLKKKRKLSKAVLTLL